MNHLHQYQLKVTLIAPFLTQSSGGGAFGLDAAIARDIQGRPLLPGSLIAGNLSHAWKAWVSMGIGDAGTYLDWLGKPSAEEGGESDGHFEPSRRNLYIEDLIGTEGDGMHTLQRIRIDPERGAVDKGALLVMEQPWVPGSEIIFAGRVRFYGNQAEAKSLPHALRAALDWAGQLGAQRGVGFGRIKQVQIEAEKPGDTVELNLTPENESLGLSLTFDQPFCLAERSLGNNLFVGTEVIPGAALKGALADAWAQLLGKPLGSAVDQEFDPERPSLGQHYDRILVRHAIPGSKNTAAIVPPCSLVKTAVGEFRDIAALESLSSLGDGAPAFAIDWKGQDFAAVNEHFGWPTLKRDLRVRTAIDAATGRAADAQLFAYESIVPNEATTWQTEIRLDQVPEEERGKASAELAGLLQALGGQLGPIGKSKSFAHILPGATKMAKPDTREDGLWIVTLQTPALMGDWRNLNEASGVIAMEQLYRDYFQQASGKALQLVRYFARQRLAGGRYLHRRYRPGHAYRPWFLTEAGSVFVLRANEDQEAAAQACVETWQRTHLPLPQWLVDEAAGQALWRSVPYLPEGGYGQVAVNLPCHDGAALAQPTSEGDPHA